MNTPEEATTTGLRNHTYDLVATLHNTLEAAAICDQYLRDATDANDAELMGFFRDLHAQYRDIADQAKRLLAHRLAHTGVGSHPVAQMVEEGQVSGSRDPAQDSLEDIGSKESFPASDPPGTY